MMTILEVSNIVSVLIGALVGGGFGYLLGRIHEAIHGIDKHGP